MEAGKRNHDNPIRFGSYNVTEIPCNQKCRNCRHLILIVQKLLNYRRLWESDRSRKSYILITWNIIANCLMSCSSIFILWHSRNQKRSLGKIVSRLSIRVLLGHRDMPFSSMFREFSAFWTVVSIKDSILLVCRFRDVLTNSNDNQLQMTMQTTIRRGVLMYKQYSFIQISSFVFLRMY